MSLIVTPNPALSAWLLQGKNIHSHLMILESLSPFLIFTESLDFKDCYELVLIND